MNTRNCSIALTGTIQYAWWAHRIAQHGEYRNDRLQQAIDSILCTDPDNVLDVYGGVKGLEKGMNLSRALLGKQQIPEFGATESTLLTGYVGNLLRLATTVLNNQAALDRLATGFSNIKQGTQAEDEPPVQAIAQLYSENISPLSPRIMIQGNGIYLRNEEFAAGIRCHLLAALRSAVLWRQSGGKLWLLMFQRSAYLREIEQLKRH